ncbi:hypothetical protein [Oceanospirillum beijerinckii]|uniref:hypothetical protein n=1 Tax=Oceanospirillum beijerinckii TaxID=64976 RepID=UPI000488E341|nr:hypothetical protein [Oceanospirillum beijerinckii]
MKSMISSITDNVRARLKTPLIGAFIFSWVAIHVKGVSVFLLVDTQTKIEILRNKDWLLWGDVIFPLILSVAYLIVLPLVNLLYDRFESGWLTPQRLAISRNKTVAQVRAETDYIRDFEYNNLSALINGKKELSEAVDKLSDVVEEFGNNLTKDNEEKF